MSAVDALLGRLSGIDEAVDSLAVGSQEQPPSAVSQTLVRGVAVEGLVTLEQFIRDRSEEWVTALSAARILPGALPGGPGLLQERIVDNLPRRYRDEPVGSRAQLVQSLATSLGSFSTGSLVAHTIPFGWAGSNIQTGDIEAILTLVGVKNPWGEVTALWARVDPRFPGNVSARSLLDAVARMRHDAAHLASPPLPLANIQTITRNVLLLAVCLDGLVSRSIRNIAAGNTLGKIVGSAVPIRRLLRDGTVWREYKPEATSRALRRHQSLGSALSEASTRARADAELVLALSGNDIVNWRVDC